MGSLKQCVGDSLNSFDELIELNITLNHERNELMQVITGDIVGNNSNAKNLLSNIEICYVFQIQRIGIIRAYSGMDDQSNNHNVKADAKENECDADMEILQNEQSTKCPLLQKRM